MSKYLLAIDPGKLQCGVAIFKDQSLAHATLARNQIDKPGTDGPRVYVNTARAVVSAVMKAGGTRNDRPYLIQSIGTLVLETPVIRKVGLQKGSQDDVLCLMGVDGAIAALISEWSEDHDAGIEGRDTKRSMKIVGVTPEGWGDQVPKHIKNQRMLKRLSVDEHETIDPKVPPSLLHNVYDSIAIGLFHLGRYR